MLSSCSTTNQIPGSDIELIIWIVTVQLLYIYNHQWQGEMECLTNISRINISSSNATASVKSANSPSIVSRDVIVFQVFVVLIGIIGFLANGVTLSALSSSKLIANKNTKRFLLNQLFLDLLSCLSLVITYISKLANITFTDDAPGSFFLCISINGELFIWILLNNSTANLMAIALERYLMIVHSISHRNHYRSWMTSVAILVTWIYGSALTLPSTLISTKVENGQCATGVIWNSLMLRKLRSWMYFMFIYIVPVVVFGYCYSRIVGAIRNQMKIMSDKPTKESTNHVRVLKRQVAAFKTLIAIVTCFFVFWTPNRLYFALANQFEIALVNGPRFFTVFFGFFNVCISPFVYATTLDSVKTYIMKIVECKYPPQNGMTSGAEMSASREGWFIEHWIEVINKMVHQVIHKLFQLRIFFHIQLILNWNIGHKWDKLDW